ncbi:hypothetical protein [Capnocytophaga sputigena]|jgi:hypothetical protein|uniref:hypothetical protein n=1 Tax=Capnocytophaga sputigena TaxID=1019 RepID=UPI00241FD3DA
MKKFLLSLLATATLVGCGSKDDNEPTPPQRPDFTKEQQNYLPSKKVKHVTASYVEAGYENGSYPSVEYKDFLKPELNQRQKFIVKTMEYFYEYDSAGRITKVTFKREGSSDIVSTLAYSDISVTITAPPPYDGIREPQSIEYGLNSSGNILSIGIYNEKQQLKNSVYAGAFTWENDNLTKMSRKVTRNGVVKERGLKFSYNSATNKNKFYLLNAIGDDIRSYQEYFALSIAVIKGAAPKNLPTEVSPLEGNDPYSSHFERPVSFSYTFDSDEFVKTIAEKENKFVPGSLYSYVPNNGNNEIATYWSELQTLIANIENKTITDKSYKLISDDGSTRIFEITVPVKVEKDSNGKTINLNVNKVCKFTVSYNNTSATNISMEATYNADMITNYELNY